MGVSPPIHIPRAMPTPPRCVVRATPTARPRAAAYESEPARGRRLAPARPIGVLFLLQRSCLASAIHRAARNRRLALGLCAPMAPRDAPPFPASCAVAAAAIPRIAVPAIPRGRAGGGRHPPDRADAHRRCGVKRTAFDRYGEAESGDVEDLNRRRGRSRCLCQRTRAQGRSARCGELWSAWDRRCGLRPGAHRRASVEWAETVARRGRARFGRSCSCLVQCSADELELFTGVA
jgi:hypothetical protein